MTALAYWHTACATNQRNTSSLSAWRKNDLRIHLITPSQIEIAGHGAYRDMFRPVDVRQEEVKMSSHIRLIKISILGAALVAAFFYVTPEKIVWSQDFGESQRLDRSELSISPEMAALGDAIFHDEDLSIGMNQSCASCHSREWGFTGPLQDVNAHGAVYEGSIPGRFGNRKPPSAAYATISPIFNLPAHGEELFAGGNFWDGRATGERLGNPAAEQALGPFLNSREQGLRDEACVVFRVSVANYAGLYKQVWGHEIDLIAFPADIDSLCLLEGPELAFDPVTRSLVRQEYDRIGISIAVFEESQNLYTSKFDASKGGMYKFSKMEQEGFKLFKGKAKCDKCHISRGKRPPFTDFTYDNLGVPKNPENPVYSENPGYIDLGLGGFLSTRLEWAAYADDEYGKVKVPTLRNVDLRPNPMGVKAYMHNGVFKSLEEVVHFYNTRDVLPVCGNLNTRDEWGLICWPAPEYAETVNFDELGNLGLSSDEEAAIVAFLKTLSDGYLP